MKFDKFNLLILLITSIFFLLTGCGNNTYSVAVDYSEYPFTDTSWTRKAEHDIETIRFTSDGRYSYSCGCGNSVNDSDLNDGYTYDDETKTITISYIETTEETISTIKIVMCDENSIKLDFDGETREFFKDNN